MLQKHYSEARIRYDALLALLNAGREISDEKVKSIIVKPAKQMGLGALSSAFAYTPPDTESEALADQFIN
jgi:hypothetical protein